MIIKHNKTKFLNMQKCNWKSKKKLILSNKYKIEVVDIFVHLDDKGQFRENRIWCIPLGRCSVLCRLKNDIEEKWTWTFYFLLHHEYTKGKRIKNKKKGEEQRKKDKKQVKKDNRKKGKKENMEKKVEGKKENDTVDKQSLTKIFCLREIRQRGNVRYNWCTYSPTNTGKIFSISSRSFNSKAMRCSAKKR